MLDLFAYLRLVVDPHHDVLSAELLSADRGDCNPESLHWLHIDRYAAEGWSQIVVPGQVAGVDRARVQLRSFLRVYNVPRRGVGKDAWPRGLSTVPCARCEAALRCLREQFGAPARPAGNGSEPQSDRL